MNSGERRYLVSTAEDFINAGVTNADAIAMDLVMTAGRHCIELDESDLVDIILEAARNCSNGKKTRGIMGFYPGVRR